MGKRRAQPPEVEGDHGAEEAAARGHEAVADHARRLERLVVEYVPVEAVHPNEYNPNRQSDHDFELLLRSMREDGFTQPVIAQRDGTIVDGEHRWRAAQALQLPEIPVVYVDMTLEQMRVSTLRHNRARGREDLEMAASVLRDLDRLGALEWAQDSLLMDDVELQRMLEDIADPELPDLGEWGDDELSTRGRDDGTGMVGMSAAAVEAQRRREVEMARARDQEGFDRRDAEATSMFRLVLLFDGEEAQLVRRVLGARPAEQLVEVVRWWVTDHALEGEPA